jgi:DNA-binding NtrC family response regulator
MSQFDSLPQLRFEICEVARVLRISRATLYQRIRERRITTQKDGYPAGRSAQVHSHAC